MLETRAGQCHELSRRELHSRVPSGAMTSLLLDHPLAHSQNLAHTPWVGRSGFGVRLRAGWLSRPIYPLSPQLPVVSLYS